VRKALADPDGEVVMIVAENKTRPLIRHVELEPRRFGEDCSQVLRRRERIGAELVPVLKEEDR